MPDFLKQSAPRRLFLAMLRSPLTRPTVQKVGGSFLRNFPGQITCQQFEDFLMDYYDGELSADQETLFHRHMKVCPMCRTSLNGYIKAIKMGQKVFAEDEKDEVFNAAPQELIDAIIMVAKQRRHI